MSEDLKNLDDKWAQRFARLEAILLSKSFAVPVEPVKKPAAVVTSEQPFFDPGASSSMMPVTQPAEAFTGASPVQATRDVTATQPVEASSTRGKSAATMTSTQPVEAPCASTDVQPASTGSKDGSTVDQSLTSTRTVTDITGVSDSEDEMASELESPAAESDREFFSDRDPVREHKLHQEHSEEANYRETMRGRRSFMGWHQIPDFDSSSSSMDNNPFAGSRTQPTGEVSIKLPADDWLCRNLEKLNLTIVEGYPSRNAETAGLLRDQFVKTPRTSRCYDMHTNKKDASTSKVLYWSQDPTKLKSAFSRVATHSLPSAPASQFINKDTLRH